MRKIVTALVETLQIQPEEWSLFMAIRKSLICEAPLCDFNEDLQEMLLIIGQQEALAQKFQAPRGLRLSAP